MIKRFRVETKGHSDIVDITDKVSEIVSESKVKNGIATVFVAGSTAAISTIEYEPGLLKDIPEVLEKIAPYKKDWAHHQTWHDDNGAAHVRSTLMSPSLVVPFENNKLILGQWQQLCLLDFDTSARTREVIVHIL